jgi:hypothetical protein
VGSGAHKVASPAGIRILANCICKGFSSRLAGRGKSQGLLGARSDRD